MTSRDFKDIETTWMDLEGIMLSEKSQTEKEKYCIVSFIYGVLKNETDEQTKNQKQKQTTGMVTRGEGDGYQRGRWVEKVKQNRVNSIVINLHSDR